MEDFTLTKTLIINGRILFIHAIILRLLTYWSSLDAVKSWMIIMDGLTLIDFDSHQLPPYSCVVHATVGMTRSGILLVEELFRWHIRVT